MRPRTSRASRGYAPPLLALLALLALTRAPSASADVAGGASGSLGASEARGAARARLLRVGDAGASARVAATPGEPLAFAQAVEVRGFSRLTQPHKAFHHVTLEVFDDARSSFARNECELRFADGRAVRSRRGPGWPRKRDIALKYLTREKETSNANEAADASLSGTHTKPTLVADFGPFDVARVVATCGTFGTSSSEAPTSNNDRNDRKTSDDPNNKPRPNAFTVTFRVVANDSETRVREWRFIAGVALVFFAPRLADVAAAYYVAGALLGVVALAFVCITKIVRLVPGGRATRAGAGALAAVSAFVVPPEHVSKVLEMYVSLWLAPARLTLAAARRALFPVFGSSSLLSAESVSHDLSSSSPDDSYLTLAYALAGTVLTLAGAGAGLWATRAWVIEKRTGDVSTHVASFARVAARALGAVLLQFCSLDAAFGGAAASIAVAMAVADNARWLTHVWRGRGGDVEDVGDASGRARRDGFFPSRRRRNDSRDVDVSSSDSDETDPDRFSSRRSGSVRASGSGLFVRRRARRRSTGSSERRDPPRDESDEDDESDEIAARRRDASPGWNWFGGDRASYRARRRRRVGETPRTMDPEPRTPPVVLVGTGAGALGASPGRTPGAGLRPWLFSSPFSFGRRRFFFGSRDSDSEEDADDDALLRERHRAAAANGEASARRAAGSGSPEKSGKAGKRRLSGKTKPTSANRLPDSNPVPVGMAARARGRFMTRAEYDALGSESTDRGLDELCGTPEFAKWMAKQSHRVRLVATDLDSDED